MFVATPMLEDIEIESLHDDDKVASSAVGNLVRTEDKTEINHFPEGQALLKRYVEPASKFELQLKFFFTHTLFSNMLLHFVTEKTSEILLILWCYS